MKQLNERFGQNDSDVDGLNLNRKTVTFEQLFEGTDYEKIADEMIQDMAFEHGFSSKRFEDFASEMIATAEKRGFNVSDKSTFNTDKFFYDLYFCTEKGLS